MVYIISDNEIIYIKKLDVIQEGMKIQKIEFDVYSKLSGTNLEKLNLSVCDKSKISLLIPVSVSENIDLIRLLRFWIVVVVIIMIYVILQLL